MFTFVLLAALFALLQQLPGQTASATALDEQPVIAIQADGESAERNRYAGTEGASPLDEVPVVPMVAATAGFLGVLSVVAFRREWI